MLSEIGGLVLGTSLCNSIIVIILKPAWGRKLLLIYVRKCWTCIFVTVYFRVPGKCRRWLILFHTKHDLFACNLKTVIPDATLFFRLLIERRAAFSETCQQVPYFEPLVFYLFWIRKQQFFLSCCRLSQENISGQCNFGTILVLKSETKVHSLISHGLDPDEENRKKNHFPMADFGTM